MSWLVLTPAHVTDRLAEAELLTIEGTGGGDGDRLSGIITQVTSLVRAKVAACHRNTLGPAGTIPEETLWAAATLAKHDLRASLPSTGGEDETELRKEEYRTATKFLNDVASCNVAVTEDSVTPAGRSSGCYGGDKLLPF